MIAHIEWDSIHRYYNLALTFIFMIVAIQKRTRKVEVDFADQ